PETGRVEGSCPAALETSGPQQITPLAVSARLPFDYSTGALAPLPPATRSTHSLCCTGGEPGLVHRWSCPRAGSLRRERVARGVGGVWSPDCTVVSLLRRALTPRCRADLFTDSSCVWLIVIRGAVPPDSRLIKRMLPQITQRLHTAATTAPVASPRS